MGPILKEKYKHYFKHVLLAWWISEYSLSLGDKKSRRKENLLTWGTGHAVLRMVRGTYASLRDVHAILLAKSTAEALFGPDDPINKSLKIDNRMEAIVTGVYEDLPPRRAR